MFCLFLPFQSNWANSHFWISKALFQDYLILGNTLRMSPSQSPNVRENPTHLFILKFSTSNIQLLCLMYICVCTIPELIYKCKSEEIQNWKEPYTLSDLVFTMYCGHLPSSTRNLQRCFRAFVSFKARWVMFPLKFLFQLIKIILSTFSFLTRV